MSLLHAPRAIVLAPGTRITYVGLGGDHSPVPVRSSLLTKRHITCPSPLDVGLWLRVLLATHLNLSPEAVKGRELIIVEPVTDFSDGLKNALVAAAFDVIEVGSVVFVQEMVMASVAAGVDACLVIDVGWSDVAVGEVFEGRTGNVQFAGIGMKDVDDWIDTQLGLETSGEAVRVAYCVAMDLEDCRRPKQVEYRKGVPIPAKVREGAVAVLFGEEDCLSEVNICKTICAILKESSVARRATLVRNIVLVGGGAMMPGFAGRLCQELQRFTAHERNDLHRFCHLIKTTRVVPSEFPSVHLAWIGASALARVPSLLQNGRMTSYTKTVGKPSEQ